jgi:hypothetical protein
VEFPSSFGVPSAGVTEVRPPPKPFVGLQSLADQLILQRYEPPSVLVNDKSDILYVSGRTGKYLEPAAGKAGWNLFAMTPPGCAPWFPRRKRSARARAAGLAFGSCPTRMLDERIDGVVMTFAGITIAKRLEAKLRDQQAGLEKRVVAQSARLAKITKHPP